MFRFDRTPFILLGLLIFTVYSCLIFYNWSAWKTQYYEDGVYKYRPLVYSPRVRIQEDKRKSRLIKASFKISVFSFSRATRNLCQRIHFSNFRPNSTGIFDREQQAIPVLIFNSLFFCRKCAKFDAYIYPLKENASLLAERLQKQLLQSRYTISSPHKACVLVAVLGSPEELSLLEYFEGREDEHLIYLLNETFDANSNVKHYFSSDIL